MGSESVREKLVKKYLDNPAGSSGSGSGRSSATKDNQGSESVQKRLTDKYLSNPTTSSGGIADRHKKVSSWVNKYNQTVKGFSDYNKKRGNRYSTDISGGYASKVEELLSEYEQADKSDFKAELPNAYSYYQDLKGLRDSIVQGNEYMAQFKDEAEYDRHVAKVKEHQNMLAFDLDTGAKEIAVLEQAMKEYKGLSRWEQDAKGNARLEELRKQYGGEQELKDLINQKRVYLTNAKRAQEQEAGRKTYEAVVKNPDFIRNSGFDETREDIGYQYVNADAGQRLDLEQKYGQYAKDFGYHAFDSLTEEEKQIYNYYRNTGDDESAARYLQYLQDTLNQRKGRQIYESGYQDKLLLEYVFAGEAGLDQFRSGVQGMGNLIAGRDDYVAPSAKQYASQMMREDLADDGWKLPSWLGGASLGQVGYDAINTTANMAPSIALGMVNPYLGAASMAATATGNAYQEAINEGYTVDQARGYGILSGASELVMEKVLGGISAFGGNALGKYFTKNMKNADTALKRIAKEIGGSMLSEFGEEYLQEVLTPVFQNLTLGTNEDVNLVSAEAWYAGILGAITGGIMEGPQAVIKGRNATADGKPTAETPLATESAGNATPGGVTDEYTATEADTLTTQLPTAEKSTAVGDKMSATESATGKENLQVKKTANVGVSKMETVQVKPDMDSFAKQFGTQAEAVRRNYMEGQDLQEYQVGFQAAYAMGLEGGNPKALNEKTIPYLTASQRDIAFSLGRDAAAAQKAAEAMKAGENVEGKNIRHSTGDVIDVTGFAETSDGTLVVQLGDGSMEQLDNVDFGTEDQAILMSTIGKIDGIKPNSANVLLQNFSPDSGRDAKTYADGVKEAYTYGYYNYSISEMMKQGTFVLDLSEQQRVDAYRLGRMDSKERTQKQVKESQKKQGQAKSGIRYLDQKGQNADVQTVTQKLDGKRSVTVQAAKALHKMGIGGEFVFFESREANGTRVFTDEDGQQQEAPNGMYYKDGTIYIDLNAGNDGTGIALYTLSHELTHFVEQWSPEKYKALADFLVREYERRGINVHNLVLEKQKALGQEVSYDEAFHELVADSMEKMLSDGDLLQKLQKLKAKDSSLVKKIKGYIDDVSQKIKKYYAGLEPNSNEGKLVGEMGRAFEKLQDTFARALVEASETYRTAGSNAVEAAAAQRRDGVQKQARSSGYDYSVPFAQQVDDWINGTFPATDTLLVGGTPQVLKDIGFPSLPITISQVNLKANINGQYRGTPTEIQDHIIKSADFKRLPELIADPVAIIADRRLQHNQWTVSEHVVDVLVEMEINGKQTLVPIKIDGKGMQNGTTIDSFSITSVHGNKDAYDRLEYALSNDSDGDIHAFYVNKNKATAVLQRAGYTITGWPNISNGFNHSISEPNSPVKLRITTQTETRQFKNWFKGSKVINPDGTPKIMYHGSPAQFTIFDKKKAKSSGLYGRGFYFTDSESHAGTYGNQYQVYLSIRNPLEHGRSTVTRAQVRKYLEAVAENEDYSIENYGTYDVDEILTKVMGRKNKIDSFQVMQDINATAIGDLVEATELFNSVNGTDFDGIVVPTETVAFRPEQIKSATDNIGTFDGTNPDIRYQRRNTATTNAMLEQVNRKLTSENARLKEDISYLKEMVKLQKTGAGGTKFTRSSVEAGARYLKELFHSGGETRELAQMLNGFYEYIAKGEELTWESVKEQAAPIVNWLEENEKFQRDPYAQEILDNLKGQKFYLDETQKQEAISRYGSIADYRRAVKNMASGNSKQSLDQLWQELSNQYPDIFSRDTGAADMPLAFAEVLEVLETMEDAEYAMDWRMKKQAILEEVYDSYWRVSTLYTAADANKAKINRLKGQHMERMDKLRADHKQNVAKLKQEHRKKLEQTKKELREKARQTHEQTVQKYQESRAKGIENRKRTEMRHKIQKVVKELNNLLLHGNKDRHVPIGLQKATAEILDVLNMDTFGAEERIAKLKEQLISEKNADKAMEISRKIDRIQKTGDRFQEKMQALKTAYDEIRNDDDPLLANAYDEGLSAHIMTLIVEVGDTALKDMSVSQLQNVYDVCQIVLTTIRNANKLFKTQRYATIAETSDRVMTEVRAAGGKRQYSLKAMEAIRKFGWNNLKPVYAFEWIGSKTFREIFNSVRKGEDVWAKDVTEARAFYLDKAKEYGYSQWNMDEWYEFTSASDMDFSLNLGQIMSLYAYSKREQAADHIRRGGIVIDESTEINMKTKLGVKVKFNPTDATAYNITDETLQEIISKLTPEQKAFVDEMQKYLSTTMGDKGNEVSLQMYGIKLFKEKNYFPLKSAGQYMAKAREQQAGDVKIKNAGFSKETVKKASNPVVLTPFMNVWAGHINEMSMYHAFVLPLEDFYRVYNFKTPVSDNGAIESVNATIQNAYGKSANQYIEQLLKDLNGGARVDSTTDVISKGMSLFKKGAVFASLSVVVQQPSAIARAVALIDVKHFIGGKVDSKRHKQLWEEVKKYAPVAVIKEMGYFDTGMGQSTEDFLMGQEYETLSEKVKAVFTDEKYRDEVLGKLPGLADEITWCKIWEAVKRETRAKNPEMDVGSEVFLKTAGDRFTEVIVKTQVYDSVLSRSANMRSKDTGMKMATAFMAEPTTSINMVADALLKGKRDGIEGKRFCRKAIGAVVASQILNSILVSFVYAARDDDENESYWEKYLSSLVSGTLDGINPATYIPFIKDIVSIAQGYSVERSDMAVISDLWTAMQNLTKDDVSVWKKVEGFVGSICQIFGLPVKNIMRDARAMYQAVDTILNGEETTGRGIRYAVKEGITGKATSNKQQLYESRLAGDEEHAKRVEARYDDEKSANAAVRSAIRESFMDDEIDMAKAQRDLILHGGIDASEAHWTMDEWEYAKETGSTDGYGKYNDFYTAVETGQNLTTVIQEYTDNGVTKTTLSGQITQHYKDKYLEMDKTSRANIKEYLVNAYEQCGVDREKAMDKIADWDFEAANGFDWSNRKKAYLEGTVSAKEMEKLLIVKGGYSEEDAPRQIEAWEWDRNGIEDATTSAVRVYHEYCEAEGISRQDFMKIRKFSNNTENDVDEEGNKIAYSAVRKIMAEINKLDLDPEQKTALARSMGWKESTVQKYKLW